MPRFNSRNHVITKQRSAGQGSNEDIAQTTLVQYTTSDLESVASSHVIRVYDAGCPYNAHLSGSANQRLPIGLVELGLDYRNYRVAASKISATYVSNATTANTQPLITIVPVNASSVGSPTTTNITAREAAMMQYAVSTDPSMTVAGSQRTTCSNYMSTKKFLGITDLRDDYETHGRHNHGGTGVGSAADQSIAPGVAFSAFTRPNRKYHWVVFLSTMKPTGTNYINGQLQIEITHYIESFEKIARDPPTLWTS